MTALNRALLSRRPALPAAVIPVLIALAVLGYVAGQNGSHGQNVERLRTARSADVVVSYPAGWDRARRTPRIPGLAITQPKAIAPGGEAASAGLLIGALPSGELAPLPRAFVAELQRLPSPEIVDLVEIQAYKYAQLAVAGFDKELTIFVIPNPGGRPTALACYAASADLAYMRACEGTVAAVTVVAQPQTYQLAPEPGYAGKISAAVAALDTLRVSLRRQLGPSVSADTAKDLAKRLADGFATAATALAQLEPLFAAEPVQQALSRAIKRAQDGYKQLAVAAGAQDAARYASAQKTIASAEAQVDRALESFALLGYSSTVQRASARKSSARS